MAIFGRNSARQRLRRAARESLNIPAFTPRIDCSPWVTGGLWPIELSVVASDNSHTVRNLKADLHEIVVSANEEIARIRRAGLDETARHFEETQVINRARGFAIRRVESTVRLLQKESPQPRREDVPDVDRSARSARFELAAPWQAITANVVGIGPPDSQPSAEAQAPELPGAFRPVMRGGSAEFGSNAAPLPEAARARHSSSRSLAPDDVRVLEGLAAFVDEIIPTARSYPRHQQRVREPGASQDLRSDSEDFQTSRDEDRAIGETAQERMRRIVAFVAGQEPRLKWAAGHYEDNSTLLVTDVAFGWIPPGIALPSEIRLLPPGRHEGGTAEMLDESTHLTAYTPGDRLASDRGYASLDADLQSRELAPVVDLGWLLNKATHWRDGLPPIVNALARAGAAGTGVLGSEINILKALRHAEHERLVGPYPNQSIEGLLNYMLIAATESLAAKDITSANYHFSWFRTLCARSSQ